jgi:hypothetical protein
MIIGEVRKLTLLDLSIFLLSAAGFLNSAALSIIGLILLPNQLTGFQLLVGEWNLISVVIVGSIFGARHHALTDELTRREIRLRMYHGCPRWMRLACFTSMIAGAMLFYLPAVLEYFELSERFTGSGMPSTVPGGFGLLCFSSFFAQLYSLLTLGDAEPGTKAT